MFSSGFRNLAQLVASWLAAFAVVALIIVNFDELRSTLGLKLAPEDFGITAERAAGSGSDVTASEAEPRPERRAAREDDERAAERRRGQRQETLFTQSVQLARSRDGHFHASASINGRAIPVLVDTGATLVALSYEDARAAGIHVADGDFRYVSQTANGQARFARVTLNEVRIGSLAVYNVAAAVGQPGRMSTTLLGMSFLGQLRMEMRDGRLLLERP